MQFIFFHPPGDCLCQNNENENVCDSSTGKCSQCKDGLFGGGFCPEGILMSIINIKLLTIL